MSTFDIRPDAPGLLRSEALTIVITFNRTGPTTGRVSWNIPTPAAGCTAETQAYCGMLVTLDTAPPGTDKIPENGKVYASDPTADPNLFAGDKIGSAFVIGAYYEDRTTTFFDVTGLAPNTPYYVSGYPSDCQYRYFSSGVHAYSQNFGSTGTPCTNGYRIVQLNPQNQVGAISFDNSTAGTPGGPSGIVLTDATGLVCGVTYDFTIQYGVLPAPVSPPPTGTCKPTTPSYTIDIDGCFATTYEDLISEINKQIALLGNPPESPLPPNANALYWNSSSQKLFQWNGFEHIELPVIVQATAPSIVVVGSYWYNPDTGILYVWNGTAWVAVIVIEFPTDPTLPLCDQSYWFDGTNAYLWNGTTWCITTLITSTQDPSVQYPAPCGSFWYDTNDLKLFRWNMTTSAWVSTLAIQSSNDPNALPVGAYWFDETNNLLFQWDTPNPGWNEQVNVAIQETEPTTPAPGKYWYNPTTMELQQWDGAVWNVLEVIPFPTDPTLREFCDLWWDLTTDELKVWDGINSQWDTVAVFYQQDEDPTLPPALVDGDMWYDPVTQTLYFWQNGCFISTVYISWATDPTLTIPNGTVWYDGTNWYVMTSGGWVLITPTVTNQDPTMFAVGTYWFNTTNNTLNYWNGALWVNVAYSTSPFTPAVGTPWFDTTTSTLMVWNGTTWVPGVPLGRVELDCAGNLRFTDNVCGSLSFVTLTGGTLFKSLDAPNQILLSVPGTDGVSDQPSYQEIGIGTDGSTDERFALMNEIRTSLGYGVFPVELTQDQLDFAVSRAIEEIRGKSAIAYRHGFFFMQINSETQRYLMTNKVQGMNKIVTVLGVYRVTSSFLSSAHGAGVYGQIVLQHLYNMGTFDLLSYHIIAEYTKLMEILFAARVSFTWNEDTRELWLHHRFPFSERLVLIEAAIERTEQQLITDRWCRAWIRRYATAVAREILAEIRGKFSTLPGAGGGITLNASDLRTRAIQEIEALQLELFDFVADRPEDYGLGTTLTYG